MQLPWDPRIVGNIQHQLSGSKALGHIINNLLYTSVLKVMSPLAKWHRTEPGITERFELFVMKKEVSYRLSAKAKDVPVSRECHKCFYRQ